MELLYLRMFIRKTAGTSLKSILIARMILIVIFFTLSTTFHLLSASTDSTKSVVSGVTYRVQIAASRVPLNNDALSGIYRGTEQPVENYEDEWYKYSIGYFPSYESARQFRDQCSVQGAFIVAFVNGNKINSRNAIIDSEQNSFSFINLNIPENITFRVQVAACRNEIPVEELKKIFENPEQLETISEEGWYKYSLNCRNDYGKACQILKNIAVEGAFIAAYNNGERVSLKSIFESISQ